MDERPEMKPAAASNPGAEPRPGPAELRREDRRTAVRYPAVVGRSWIGWKDGARFECHPAWILDISSGGCLIGADAPPPTDRPVWLRLDGELLPDWFEARVRATRTGLNGVTAARLRFPGTCPYALFMAVAFGRFERVEPSPNPRGVRPSPGRRDP